jgi:hypothetical protein
MTGDTVLVTAAVVGSGLTAGVLFSVALSIVPAFLGMPAQRYVELHKLVGRRFDRVMPPLVVTWTLLDAGLATTANAAATRGLFACAAAAGCGVVAVSQLGNVPLNRRVKGLPPGPLPAGWVDPRPRWRGLHLIRTYLAMIALAANAGALLAHQA